jgi:ribose transport system ATP-binding protein
MAAERRLALEGLALAQGAPPLEDGVRPGEIIGLAGLEGHGQEAFLEVLAGLRRPAAGRVRVTRRDGSVATVEGFRQAVRCGVAYLARDRRANGIFPSLSIADNFAMASLGRDLRLGLIDRGRRRRRYERWRDRLSIVAPAPEAPITTLSGGNQQKVLLARWLALEPTVLLLNDPTRGVDQRTRETLYEVFADLARRDGVSIVLLSTEIEEVLRLCDRVLVFRERRIAASLAGDGLTADGVIAAMFGRAA